MKLNMVLVIGLTWFVAACSSIPLEQKYSASELRELVNQPMPRCVKEQCRFNKDGVIQCWTYEPFMGMVRRGEDCLDEYSKWRDTILDRQIALDRLYDMHAATAPSCINQIKIPKNFLLQIGVDPNREDAVAQALARGAVIQTNDACMAALCKWQKALDPTQFSVFCESDRANLAKEDKVNAPSNASGGQ